MDAPRMIVTDLDGTLLDINKKISSRTKEYLQKLKNEGKFVVIATGRVLNSAIKISEGAKFANYIISNTGSIIYDVENRKEIFRANISKEDVNKICSLYNEKFEYIDICDSMYYNRYTNSDDIEKILCVEKIKDREKFLTTCENAVHIIISTKKNEDVEEMIDIIKFEIPYLDIKIMQDSFDNKKYIEIYAPNLSKYKGIQKIAEIEGIENKDIIAFGDSLNDIDMIKNCGIGVAMGNSLERIKEIANYTTISHNENGVVEFLEKIYGGNNEASSTKSE